MAEVSESQDGRNLVQNGIRLTLAQGDEPVVHNLVSSSRFTLWGNKNSLDVNGPDNNYNLPCLPGFPGWEAASVKSENGSNVVGKFVKRGYVFHVFTQRRDMRHNHYIKPTSKD